MKRAILLALLTAALVLTWRHRPQAVGSNPVDPADLRAREGHARDVLALGERIRARLMRARRIDSLYRANEGQ